MRAAQHKMKYFTSAKWERVGETTNTGFLPIQPEMIDANKEKVSGFAFFKAEILSENDSKTTSEVKEELMEVKTISFEENIELKIAQVREEAYLAAKAELEQEYLAKKQEFQSKNEELFNMQINAWKELEIKHEQKCLDLALAIAKKILSTAVEIKPDYIQTIIKEALTQLSGTTPLKIKVSPQDYEFIEVVGLPRELAASELTLTYEMDDTINSGCIIETNYGEVDFVLENMFERIKKNLIEALK